MATVRNFWVISYRFKTVYCNNLSKELIIRLIATTINKEKVLTNRFRPYQRLSPQR